MLEGLRVGGGRTTLTGVVREGISEEVTHELRPEDKKELVVQRAWERGFQAEGTAYAKALPQEGINGPRVLEEQRRGGPSSWKGVTGAGEREVGRAGGRSPSQAPARAQRGGADRL